MHKKKMIAPIIITVVLALYYIGYGIVIFLIDTLPLLVKILGGVVPLFVVGAIVYVLIERIKEIKKGEEDDLDKY